MINISTGLKEYVLTGSDGATVSIWINPTDTTFIEKMVKLFDEFTEKEDALHEELDTADYEEIVKVSKRMDAEMRERLIEIFGTDVVTPLIGTMNVYATAEGYGAKGEKFPIWANILLAIMHEVQIELTEEQKKSVAKVQKYTRKYTKKK